LRGIYQNFEDNKKGLASNRSYSPNDLRVAREALAIHALLASRLGMHRLKNEIEGAAFRILYRRQYDTVTSLTHLSKPCNEDDCSASNYNDGMRLVLDKVSEEVEQLLQNDPYFTKYVDHYKVTTRVKESYSLWKKMKLQLKSDSILEVSDALALRVVFSAKKMTPDEDDEVTSARDRALCYYVQQTCTHKFKPLEDGRYKDYIARPKANGYQSLHYTAVMEFENDQWPFEIQVRSDEMHHVAEFGLAAHWDYKAQDSTASAGNESAQHHYAFKLDQSSDAYLRSVQEWHWQQAQARGAWLTDSSSSSLFQKDAEMTERLRDRDEHLAPYLDALMKDHSNLSREHVFIFLTNENDDSHVLELPKGASILDALRESGITSSRELEAQLIRNGSLTSITQQLGNGDIITIPTLVVP
jgi:(p)ppGpp synthase/HD superfamily hydrolase